MKPELIEILRMRWQRLAFTAVRGRCWLTTASCAILFVFISSQDLLNEHSIPPVCT